MYVLTLSFRLALSILYQTIKFAITLSFKTYPLGTIALSTIYLHGMQKLLI